MKQSFLETIGQLIGAESLTGIVEKVKAGIRERPKVWREDAERIVAGVDEVFDIVEDHMAGIIVSVQANDTEAIGRHVMAIEALRHDSKHLVGAFVNRGLDVTRSPGKFIGSGDIFKGERELAKDIVAAHPFSDEFKERIGADEQE